MLEENVYSALINLYENQKKQKLALKYLKLCNSVKENIKQKKLNKTIAELKAKNIQLFIKREDKIHPFVSGNKFRKLKYNIQEAKSLKQDTLLTFGGAFSNHILATAVAGKLAGLKTIGVIRGDELAVDLQNTLANNSTLQQAHENGMQFYFVSREMYRKKTEG